MKNGIKKAIEVLLIVLLGISLAACGKKTEDAEPVDEYGYISSFAKLNISEGDNAYVSTSFVEGDYYHYLMISYNETGTSVEYEYHKYNMKDGSDEKVALPAELFKNSSYIREMAVTKDGTLKLLMVSYDMETYEANYAINNVDASGNFLNSVSLDKLITAEDQYIEYVRFDKEGNTFISTETRIIAIDTNGKITATTPVLGYVNSMITTSDGKVYMTGLSRETYEYYFSVFDGKTGKTDKLDFVANNINSISEGLNGTLIINLENKVKSFNPETGEEKELWNWFEVDVGDNYINEIVQTGEDSFIAMTQEYTENSVEYYIINIRKELLTEETRRTKVKLGCTYLDYQLKSAITKYNRANEKIRIIPVQYLDDTDDYETSFSKFEEAITSGEIDIVDARSINFDQYAKKGAFADLSDYYKKDIDSSKYFANAFKSAEYKGKKYAVVYSMNVEALAAHSADVGNKETITLDEIIALRKANPKKAFFDYATKEMVFYFCFYGGMSDYIDYEKATCSFNTESFVKLLEFANTFDDDIDYENYDEWELLRNGEILFASTSVSDITDFQVKSMLMGDDTVLVGYPSETGRGAILTASGNLCISSKSKHKDEAWDFFKYVLGEEAQNNLSGMPVLRSSFEKKLTEAGTPEYYIDENGNKVETPKVSYGTSSGSIEVYAATKAQLDIIRTTVENAESMPYLDEEILTLISEEIDAFFKGGKSAKEVADVIQSRVKIYLAEKY